MISCTGERLPVHTCTPGPLPFMSVNPADQSQAVLLAVGQLLGREIALDDLVRMLVDRIVISMNAERGTLYLLDAARKELFSKAAHLPELQEIRLKLGQGIAGHVASTGEILNVSSTHREMRFFSEIDRLTGFTSRSILAAPLKDRQGRIFGVVQVLNKKGGTFTRQDESTLLTLVDQAALALEATSLYHELRRAETDPIAPVSYHFNRIIGDGEAMRKVYRILDKAAPTNATVLIRGESGTGKELIARAVQVNSPRRNKPFIKVDCAALPPSLIENELFGHEKGAYTGAAQRSVGKFEAAHGGTLFIDELGELPLSVQGRLLRVIQDREFERVGGTETIKVDVRIITATNRDLEALVEEGLFRADLYYRVRVVEVNLPPLRARGRDDLRRLVMHFAAQSAQKHNKVRPELSEAAMQRLLSYPWPGNVRELEHCIESAVVMSDEGVIEVDSLPLPSRVASLPAMGARTREEHEAAHHPPPLRTRATLPPGVRTTGGAGNASGSFSYRALEAAAQAAAAQAAAVQAAAHGGLAGNGSGHLSGASIGALIGGGAGQSGAANHAHDALFPPGLEVDDEATWSLAEVEKRHILKVMELTGNNRSAAARLLQIGRNTLGRKLKEYGLSDGDD